MKYALIILIFLCGGMSKAQTDTVLTPPDPYPIEGVLYEFESDSQAVNLDTIFINGCHVKAFVNDSVIGSAITDNKGKYKIELPVSTFKDNHIFVETDCDGYVNLKEGPFILYGTFYPVIGMRFDFALENLTIQHYVGYYFMPNRGGGFKVSLHENGTYEQNMRNCTWGFKSEGNWTFQNDTIYLHAEKLFDRRGKKVSFQDQRYIPNTYRQMNKLLFRNDTLFLTEYTDRLCCPMKKQEEKPESK